MSAIQGELVDIIRRDRARRTRRRKFGEFLSDFISTMLAGLLVALFNGWLFMLGVGVVHAHWMPSVPTIGYWWAVLIVWLLRGIFSGTAKRERQP